MRKPELLLLLPPGNSSLTASSFTSIGPCVLVPSRELTVPRVFALISSSFDVRWDANPMPLIGASRAATATTSSLLVATCSPCSLATTFFCGPMASRPFLSEPLSSSPLVAGGNLLAVLVGDDLLLRAHGLAALLVRALVVLPPEQVLHLVLRELALGQKQLLGLDAQRLLHQLLLVRLHRIPLAVDALHRLALLGVPVVHVVAGKLGHHTHLRRGAQVLLSVLKLLILDGVPLEMLGAAAAAIADPHLQRVRHGGGLGTVARGWDEFKFLSGSQ
mmetsp:Transcript_56134/g.174048  ORF Transcript_56134/g.174048 Transcript_56134/m.174048 type:complete len:275 (+) Transcript_56134:417-1241(+)